MLDKVEALKALINMGRSRPKHHRPTNTVVVQADHLAELLHLRHGQDYPGVPEAGLGLHVVPRGQAGELGGASVVDTSALPA
jgi:hypothetical protein